MEECFLDGSFLLKKAAPLSTSTCSEVAEAAKKGKKTKKGVRWAKRRALPPSSWLHRRRADTAENVLNCFFFPGVKLENELKQFADFCMFRRSAGEVKLNLSEMGLGSPLEASSAPVGESSASSAWTTRPPLSVALRLTAPETFVARNGALFSIFGDLQDLHTKTPFACLVVVCCCLLLLVVVVEKPCRVPLRVQLRRALD